jgi:hemerythrin-like domain-containing protein
LLQRLVEHTATRGVDDEARDAARGVMRYFELAAPQHHADEEQDLFPALLESMAGSDPVCLRELTTALTAEHRALEALWRRLRAELQALIDDGRALAAAPVDAFVAGYLAHVRREDDELFPMAARLLGDDELERVGRSMRLRRGITQVD